VLHATGGVAELTQGRVELSTTLVVRGSTGPARGIGRTTTLTV
jgi:hypothetical protein